MSVLINKLEEYFWVIVVLGISLSYLEVSILANNLQRQISIPNNFVEFLYSANNFVAFCIPIIAFTFFAISTRIMLSLTDIDKKEKHQRINTILGYSFTPLLIFMIFYFFNFAFFIENGINTISDIENATFLFGLTFYDLRIISYLSWGSIYIILLFQLVYYEKICFIKSGLIVFLPSLILYLFKIGLSYL